VIYEYECENKHITEVQQSLNDEPLKECPTCKLNDISVPVKKIISKSSFILTGNGWAKDSYSK
jgi:putative FmdB family regulatory protein